MEGAPHRCTCLHCNKQWWTFKERPVVCPKCKSYNWDKPPQRRRV